MLNFAVDCQLLFRFARDGQEAAESKDAFISHITEVFIVKTVEKKLHIE